MEEVLHSVFRDINIHKYWSVYYWLGDTGSAMNRWGIPEWLEREVRQRDRACVYCRVPMVESPTADGSRKSVATWEHIINDARIVTPQNIARCCASCNSSKGTNALAVWIESSYCKRRGIRPDTVAEVVKQALRLSA